MYNIYRFEYDSGETAFIVISTKCPNTIVERYCNEHEVRLESIVSCDYDMGEYPQDVELVPM